MAREKLMDSLWDAYYRLNLSYKPPTRLDIRTEVAKALAEEAEIDLPKDWDPPNKSLIGEWAGVPMYINNDMEEIFIMSGIL